MLHYALHHHRQPRTALERRLRELHMRHHFEDDTPRLRDQRAVVGHRLRDLRAARDARATPAGGALTRDRAAAVAAVRTAPRTDKMLASKQASDRGRTLRQCRQATTIASARLRAVIGRLGRRLRPTRAGSGLTPTQISVLFTLVRDGPAAAG